MHLYSHLLQLVALPSVSLFTESRFWDIYRKLSRPGPDHIFRPPEEATVGRIRDVVRHAYQNVEFYRNRMDGCGLKPDSIRSLDDLRYLPPTTKADIAAFFPDGITDTSQQYQPWRYRSTSGTIERLTVVHDYRKRDAVRAAEIFAARAATEYRPGMKYLEIPPDVCRNVCGVAGTVDPSIFRFAFENLKTRQILRSDVVSDLRGMAERQLLWRRLTLPSYGHEGVTQTVDTLNSYLHQIDKYRPYLIKALPIYLYILALHIQETGVRPPAVTGGLMPMGSSITPQMKKVVEQAFEVPVHEDYGSAELGAIGAECGAQKGIHPFAGLFHVEVVRNGCPAKPGELGRVLITDLYSYAMPFIRYEIGDVAMVQNGSCTCGLDSLRLDVQGRQHDCLEAADGSVIPSDRVVDAVLACPGVRIFRLEWHDYDDVYLEIVPTQSVQPDMSAVEAALKLLTGRALRVFTRVVPTLLPEPGGKYRFVKNCTRSAGKLL